MQRLLAGYHRFRTHGWPEKRRQFETLAEHGQSPRALVLACIDSRVDPGMIFDAAPGGIKALINGAPETAHEFVAPWMSIARPACESVIHTGPGHNVQQRCEHEVVKLSLANLMTFPWIAERVNAGSLQLHGAWFDIRMGVLMMLQPDGSFAAQ